MGQGLLVEGDGVADTQTTEDVVEIVPEADMIDTETVDPSDTVDGSTDYLEPIGDNESVEESVRKVVEAEKKKQAEGQEDPKNADAGTSAPHEVQKDLAPKQGKSHKKKEVIPDLGKVDIPARLNSEEREWWGKLPNEFKPAVARFFKEQSAAEGRRSNEYNRIVGETKHLLEAVRPHYTSMPELAERGITEGQFVSSLVATHKQLMNPKTSKAKIAQVARSLGHNVQFVNENGEIESDAESGVQNNEISQLRSEINALKSELSQQVTSQQATPHVQAIERVMQAKDQQGNLLYPEASDHETLVELKPLVSDLVRKGSDYGSALKEAIEYRRYKSGQTNGRQQTRPSQNTQTNKTAVDAAQTARGRVAPNGVSGAEANGFVAKPGTTIEEDIQAVIDMQKRGIRI